MRIVVAVLLFAGCHREPPLPPATAHCASGVGGGILCSEWAGDTTAAENLCLKLEGSWGTGGCPADVSAAGGTCTLRTPTHTGLIRYGSAWKPRADAHCEKQHGRYRAAK